MLTKFKSAWALLVVATLSSATMACAGSDELGEEEEENVSSAKLAVCSDNGVAPNGITTNGITTNGITTNGITTNGITTNGITTDVITALNGSDLAQKFFTYLVSCALPAGQNITLTINTVATTFYGGLGLAPQWGVEQGSCDTACQKLVSACMLARVNFYGDHVPLSVRGNFGPLATTSTERTAFPKREAAYWGNIFTAPQLMYACKEYNSTLITRSCGPGITNSIMTVRGDCTEFCDAADPTHGYFANCKDSGNITYPTVTVYRE
jgi:hypothetical protein